MANKDKPSIALLVLTGIASALVASRRFVGYDDVQASVQGQAVKGLADTDAAVGDAFPIVHKGTGVVETAGAIPKGARVISSANGRALAAPAAASAVVTGITVANPGVVTSAAHGLSSGDVVVLTGVAGMVEVNNKAFIVTVINANSFSIGATTGNTAYTSGGIATRVGPDGDGAYVAARALEAAAGAGEFIEVSLT